MEYTESGVCRVGELTCMGCCGREYGSREEIIDAIRRNTHEYVHSVSKKAFRERPHAKGLRSCGVCPQVIFSNQHEDMVTCPLHPAENDGTDLRIGHCDVRYLCKAAVLFGAWNPKKREDFITFIRSKDLDWFSFSMGMDSDTLIEEFLAQYRGR